MGILILFLNLVGNLSAFHHGVLCWLWVCCKWPLLCSLYTHFDKSFYYEQMLNFFKCFFCIYWDDTVIFIFPFFNVVYYTDLHMLNHPCDPEINPIWSRCMILFTYCCMRFANILLRIFAFVFMKDIRLKFSFLVVSLFAIGIRPHRMNLRVFPPLQLIYFFISVVSVVLSPLSFLILFIRILSVSSLWAWLKIYQFCLSFQKNQLLVLIIFSFGFF